MNGQAKKDFENWLKQQPFSRYNKNTKQIIINGKYYYELNQIFQNALIIEWFDSVGDLKDGKQIRHLLIEYYIEFDKIQEATEKAIEKAVEIYNNLK